MSVVQIKNVKLQRADQSVSWGFNIQGGRDINSPLMICKVTPGTLAERCSIKYGDFILKIGNTSAEFLSHSSCRDVIIAQGNNLEMTLLCGGVPTHDDYAACFRFPPHQQMSQPSVHMTGSPQVGVQLGANKALLSQSYNSPMGLYSNKNVADTLSSAIRNVQMNDESYQTKLSQSNNGNVPFNKSESNGLRSLSSNGSSLSASPSSHMMESSASSKLLDTVQLLDYDELNSSPSTLSHTQQQQQQQQLLRGESKAKVDNSLPKPFYLSSQTNNQSDRTSGSYGPIKYDPMGSKVAKNLQSLDFHLLESKPTMQHSPVSTQSSKSHLSSEEDSEAFQKYRQLESKRNSFAKPSLSMDANNNYETNDPDEIEKKKALLKEELGARLSQGGDNHVMPSTPHYRMHKSASIAIDNMNYAQLADLQTMMENATGAHESPKFPQPTIQSYYLSQLSGDDNKKHEYKVNKLVSPTYKPFSAYSSYMKYTQPNAKSYIAKLDDPSKPSMTQSRSFKLLQETLENDLKQNDAVIHDSFSKHSVVKRCSINSETSPLTQQQRMKSIQELDKEAEETYERLIRNRYQFANNRSASIAVSSPSQLKAYNSSGLPQLNNNTTINKNTPYYMNYKKLIKEDENNNNNSDTSDKKQSEVVFRNNRQADNSSSDFGSSSSSEDYDDSLKRFRDKHYSSNYKSNSLVLSSNNKSNVNNYLTRKYSSQIEPVSETREDDDINNNNNNSEESKQSIGNQPMMATSAF